MSYSKIEDALSALLPGAVYKLDAPDELSGNSLTRYIVWTPTGSRALYAEGGGAVRIWEAMVTVCTQAEDDNLPAQTVAALQKAHIAVGAPVQEYADDSCTWYTDIPCEVV